MSPLHPRKLSLLAGAIALSGCATLNDAGKNYGTAIGCVGGAVLGAGLTYALTGDADKALIGGGLGGAAGCAAGRLWQNRLQELEHIAQQENLKIQLETLKTRDAAQATAAPAEAGIVAQVQDEGMFPVGSARLSADGERQVRKLAGAFAPKPGQNTQTAILVVGHTDATGSAATNQRLSQQRARAVASILADLGIARERMYFQGAGAARPVADNSDPIQRGKNRRVEIVEVNDRSVLIKRINAEQNNPKYLAHGTATQRTTPAASTAPFSRKSAPSTSDRTSLPTAAAQTPSTPTRPAAQPARRRSSAVIDFGGQPATAGSWTLGQTITPKSGGFALVSSAYAAEIPMSSCEDDRPRQSGEVFNLASGEALQTRETTDYLPGYNNRVWAEQINGHLVTISPVSILRDGASVDRQPFVQVVQNYDRGNRKALVKADAVANTYEGEDRVLYRVFVQNPQAPVSCMDVVFSKGNSRATDGVLFYPKSNGEAYTTRFVPVRT